MANIVDEFNTTCIMFLDLMYSFTNNSDISFYKKAMTQMIIAEKNTVIEQFIIHCLIYNQQIMNKDIDFFKNINLEDKVKKQQSLLNIINMKNLVVSFDSDQIDMMFQYLQLLCNFSTEYLGNKIN